MKRIALRFALVGSIVARMGCAPTPDISTSPSISTGSLPSTVLASEEP